jgi:hypothetical protein
MANSYEFGNNLFKDVLLDIMLQDSDIGHIKNKNNIFDIFRYILHLHYGEIDNSIYLDFDIKNKNGYYIVLGNNLITCLWVSNIIPTDIIGVVKKNEYIIENRKYVFDNINKKIKFELIN